MTTPDSIARRRLCGAALAAPLGALLPHAASAAVTTPSIGGRWQNGPNLPYFPVHMHVLPDANVMMWPGDGGVNGDDPRVWNPATGVLSARNRAGFDLFCSGHNFLPDGRLFVTGGHISNNVGLAEAAIYDPAGNAWTRLPRMNLGRWYPTTTLLASGDVLVVSGSVDTSTGANPVPQVWKSALGRWQSLNSAQLKLPLYPYMFLAPNGRVFNAGPGVTTRYLDCGGWGTWSVVGNRSFGGGRGYGGAVMYAPGRILAVGGGDPPTATAEVIDLNAASPAWRAVGSMQWPRRHMSTTVLPDGRVLATGGTRGTGFNNRDPALAVRTAELWDPATGRWSEMATAYTPRWYHSIALLLPDARVFVTGGNGYTQSEIYSPPYLFTGTPRPTIASAPASVGKGVELFVGTPDAAVVNAVSWVRLPSVTHTNDMNQSFFRSTQITRADGGIRTVSPRHTSVPSGHYMLFLLRDGVPSVARIVRLG
ncbi:galactose oxidase-like domain-containing protein [Caldimonas tepidiphila]|uniref:galactose oxidase-like domain-containing protein n=1 Tax=Caldimonas tepidiphila TaxID=2315841 RepID=UPI000E5B913C|nr:glyoxal oxidase [Caldimonas tepidiphila]